MTKALSRVARFGLPIGGSAALLGGLWWASTSFQSPAERAALTAPPGESVITVPVRMGALSDTITRQCGVEVAAKAQVPLRVDAEVADVAVVTDLPVKSGERVRDGRVLIELSGRPVFAVSGKISAYRDLRQGSVGPDVRQLQEALLRWGYLSEPADGVLGNTTAAAVRELYARHGYEPPSGAAPVAGDRDASDRDGEPRPTEESASPGVVWPQSEHVIVRLRDAVVKLNGLTRGAPVGEKSMTLESSRVRVRCEVEPESADVLADVSRGVLVGGGERIDVKVQHRTSDALTLVPLNGTIPRNLSRVAIEFVVHESKGEGLVVPLSALWTDSSGKTSVHAVAPRQADVQVIIEDSVNGEALVRPAVDGALSEGDEVQVSDDSDAE